MEHNCDPGDVANGIELDWLRFYYEIWTSGGDKFNVGEILDVWDEAGDYGWNNMSNSLLPTVEDIWGKDDPKTTLFKNKAARTGVKHG
jgi:hypothetical protein